MTAPGAGQRVAARLARLGVLAAYDRRRTRRAQLRAHRAHGGAWRWDLTVAPTTGSPGAQRCSLCGITRW